MPLKLVIFDLDGTLVDTSIDITRALNYATKPYGLGDLAVEDTIRLVGEGITRLVEKALGEDKAWLTEEVVKRFLDYYSAHLTDYSRIYPGVRETLEALGGFKKAVISNKRESLSVELLRRLDLLRFFDLVVGSDTAFEKKPSPAPVLYALRKLSVSPAETVIVGDSPLDIEAGSRADIKTVAVTYGYRGRELLSAADYMADAIGDILPLINGISSAEDRRREKRHLVPEIYGEYIKLRIRAGGGGGEFIEAVMMDFSRHGLRMESPVRLTVGSLVECVVSIPKSLTKEAVFSVRVRHCSSRPDRPGFIIGAEIEEIEDEVWFRVVSKAHDFIWDREYFRERP